LDGEVVGHNNAIQGGVVKQSNSNTFLSGSLDGMVKRWNATTLVCLTALSMDSIGSTVWSMILTSDETRIVCGLGSGRVEICRVSDFWTINVFSLHTGAVPCICELEDGSFVSGSNDNTLKRWSEDGTVIRTFSGHSNLIWKVIELKRGVVVSGSWDKSLKIWRVSTGECLHTLTLHCQRVQTLMKLSEDVFISGSFDKTVRVWNGEIGHCIQTIQAGYSIQSMIMLRDGSLLIGSHKRFEIRRLK